MEAFDAPKPQHDDDLPQAWPPGMDATPEPNGTVSEPFAHPEPAAHQAGAEPETHEQPEPEELSEGEVLEPHAVNLAEVEDHEPLDVEPEPVPEAEELSEGEVLEPHAVNLPEDEAPPEAEDEAPPEAKAREPADNEPASLDDEPTLVGSAAVATASTEPSAPRRPSLPSLRRLRGANINVGVRTFDPRVAVLVALLAVAGAAGLIVMRSGTAADESAPATKSATPAPAKSSSKPATPAGYTRVTVAGGGYAVDVPTALARTVNGSLVTFSSSDQSRAYAVSGRSSDDTGLSAVAKRVVAGYRDSFRLSTVRITGSGDELRVTANGRRRGGGNSRQDIVALVFRGDDGKGTYVLQRFTPRGKSAPQAELDTVRASVQPAG